MVNEFLKKNINNVWGTIGDGNGGKIPRLVEVGFSQVEPNHLSAQRTGQSYAQLPAAANIDILQQGQFVKYDYANEEVNLTGPGEWMLVYNEIKLYREFQNDCEFAMIKDNYNARVYSPFGGPKYGEGIDVVDYYGQGTKQTRYYGGTFATGNINGGAGAKIEDGKVIFAEATYTEAGTQPTTSEEFAEGTFYVLDGEDDYVLATEFADTSTYYIQTAPEVSYPLDRVTTSGDYYEPHFNDDPFHIAGLYTEKLMKEGTKMVPRVFKTNVGDIFTTNAIDEDIGDLEVGQRLCVDLTTGFLVDSDNANADEDGPCWQIVKIYTMPDHQVGVKIMRIY